jgi:hypothetical protein
VLQRVAVRVGAAVVGVVLAVGAFAGSAAAHIEPISEWVQAGEDTTVLFAVEHGCDDDPTVEVSFDLPDGVTDADAVHLPDGWSGEVRDGTVVFEGGPTPAGQIVEFEIGLIAPETPGSLLMFPAVQRCEGRDGGPAPEPEQYVPAVLVVSAEDAANFEEHGDGHGHSGRPNDDGTEEASAATSTATADEESSSTGLVIGVVVVVALVAAAGAGTFVVRRRRS